MPEVHEHRVRARRGVPRYRLVTERDREIVGWVGRQRIVAAVQVQDRFGLGRAVAYARLAALLERGLLCHERVFHGVPGVYLATRSGLRLAGSGLPPARVDVRTYEHDLEAAALCVELEREFGVGRVVTERELRAVDSGGERPRFGARLGAGQHAGRLHFPDLAVERFDGNRVLAVELERTPKRSRRLETIVRAYLGARHIACVRYCVSSDAVERSLAGALAVVGPPAGLFDVRRWPIAAAGSGA